MNLIDRSEYKVACLPDKFLLDLCRVTQPRLVCVHAEENAEGAGHALRLLLHQVWLHLSFEACKRL